MKKFSKCGLLCVLFSLCIIFTLLSGCSNSPATMKNTQTTAVVLPSTNKPSPSNPASMPKTTAQVSSTNPIAALPATIIEGGDVSVSIVTSADSVQPGQNFDVAIRVSTDIPTRGVQCTLNWDSSKAICNSVEEGPFYKEFAKSNGFESDVLPVPLEIDNELGQFPPGKDPLGLKYYAASIIMLGGRAPDGTLLGPTGSGNIFILHMTAKEDVSGTIDFILSHVIINDNSLVAQEIDCAVNNGQVTIATF